MSVIVDLPDFVTREFLQNIFKKSFADGQKLEILNFNGEFATQPGDNYGSDMSRVAVNYEIGGVIKRKTLIIKMMPSNERQQSVMTQCNTFPREIHTYCKLLVDVDKLLTSIGDKTKLSPQCYHTATNPRMMLVFEDTRDKNYKVRERKYQLNYDEASSIIVKLAKLHAASAVLYDQDPSIMEPYLEGSISNNPDRKEFLGHYRNCTRALGNVINEWGEEWKTIGEKVRKLEATITDKGCKLYTRDPTTFSVLNHNDLWVKNLFFKNEGEKVEDMLFIDYQLSYFGSLGIDLNYLFYGTLSEEVRILKFKDLLKIYHENFKNVLKALNYKKKIPTFQDVYVEYLKSGFNRILATFAMTPILMMKDSKNMNLLLVDSDEGEKFRYSLFNTVKYKNFIQKLLLEFDDYGFLD